MYCGRTVLTTAQAVTVKVGLDELYVRRQSKRDTLSLRRPFCFDFSNLARWPSISILFGIRKLRRLELVSSLWLTVERIILSLLARVILTRTIPDMGTNSQARDDKVNTSRRSCFRAAEIQIDETTRGGLRLRRDGRYRNYSAAHPRAHFCAGSYFNPTMRTRFWNLMRATSSRGTGKKKKKKNGLKSVTFAVFHFRIFHELPWVVFRAEL